MGEEMVFFAASGSSPFKKKMWKDRQILGEAHCLLSRLWQTTATSNTFCKWFLAALTVLARNLPKTFLEETAVSLTCQPL